MTAEAAKLQTQSAERSGTLSANQIVETPQKGRHFLSLLTLMPGVINNNNFEGPAGGGIGALLVRRGHQLAQLLRGGHQQHGVRPGTEPVALVVGLACALRLATDEREARREKPQGRDGRSIHGTS